MVRMHWYIRNSRLKQDGGISDRGKNPGRVAYSFCTGYRPRCLVELYRKYLFLGPRGSYHWPKFYVQTDSTWQPGSEYWYTNRPVGKNTLGRGYIQDMMERGDTWELQKSFSEEINMYQTV